MPLGHVIALDPTLAQQNAFARAAGCARFAYNWGLAWWNRAYQNGGKPTAHKVKKAFNQIKEQEFPWIYDSRKDANQSAFDDLGRAFTNFFDSAKGKRKGKPMKRPRFKKKGKSRDSFYVANDKFSFSEDGWSVRLPVIGMVRLREPLRLRGKILSGRVARRADRWFLSVTVDGESRVPTTPSRSIVGVDLGLKTAVVLSSGESLDAPKPLRKNLRKLARLQRSLHRKQAGSNNRFQAKRKVAKLYVRIANIRHDFLHKVTTKIARENQAVVIEDLNVAGMVRNEKLSRAFSDVGMGMFRTLLEYKATKFGTILHVAERFFPSSKRCSGCGCVKETLSLTERAYDCAACGLSLDRDVNAAINLERYPGLRGNLTPTEIGPLRLESVPKARPIADVGSLS